jgi:hypothetical protein
VVARIGAREGVTTSELLSVDYRSGVEGALGDKVLHFSESLLYGAAIALLAKIEEGLILEEMLLCHGIVLLV